MDRFESAWIEQKLKKQAKKVKVECEEVELVKIDAS
jgi:hypothetical protein